MFNLPIRFHFSSRVRFYLTLIICLTLPRSTLRADDTAINLGVVLSLSGYGAITGQDELNGLILAAEEINSRGGIKGRPLRLIIEDNHSELKSTASGFQKLAAVDKVPLIFGPNWAEFGEVAAPIAESNKAVLLSASSHTETLTKGRQFVFTSCPPHALAVKPLAEFIAKQKFNRIALLKANNAFADAISSALLSNLKTLDASVGSVQSFNPGETDYRSTITALKKKEFDAVVVFLLQGGEMDAFLRQKHELGFNAKTFSSVAVTVDELLLAKPALSDGLIFYDYPLPAGPDFVEKYRRRFKRDPQYTSPKAYDNVYAAKNAIEICGASARDIQRCLRSKSFKGITGEIKFGPDGMLEQYGSVTELRQFRAGKAVPLDPTSTPPSQHGAIATSR